MSVYQKQHEFQQRCDQMAWIKYNLQQVWNGCMSGAHSQGQLSPRFGLPAGALDKPLLDMCMVARMSQTTQLVQCSTLGGLYA